MNFIKFSFATDCAIGILVILIVNTTGQEQYLDFTDKRMWLVNIVSSIFNVGGEFFIIKAIETGVTGPAISIVNFNSVLVGLLLWGINGVELTPK
jgi:uncharacterized membrane protein